MSQKTNTASEGEWCEDGICLTVINTPCNIESDTIKVLLTNRSDSEIITGAGYAIEKFANGKWEEVPLHYAFIDIAFVLYPNQAKTFDINLQRNKHDYEAGRYRVVKGIRKSNNREYVI